MIRPAETIVKQGGTSYIFVTEGIDNALRRACEAAGTQDVMVNGGADIARQYLQAGAVQEPRLHFVPVVLDAGTRSSTTRLRPRCSSMKRLTSV